MLVIINFISGQYHLEPCHLAGWRLEVPRIPSLGLINLLQKLTELRENILLTRWPGYYIQIDLRQRAGWKRRLAQGRERPWSFHAGSGGPPFPNFQVFTQPGCSLNPVLLGFYRGFIAQAHLIKSLPSAQWFSLLPSSSLWGMGMKVPIL